MSTVTRLPVSSPIVGLRLHSRHAPAGSPQAAKVAVLLDLGERQARRDAEGRLVTELVTTMQKAVAEMPTIVGARLDEVAAIAVELGISIAREVVGAAIDKGLVDPTATVVRCLRDCVHGPSRADLVVRLHPKDLELVQQNLVAVTEVAAEVQVARFVADPTVPRGGVNAETMAGRLRYDPREALERMADEVRREVTA